MAKPGPKPQNKQQKQRKGTDQPCRETAEIVEFPKAEKVPDPPAWITYEQGVDLWNELAPLLLAQKVLANVDVHALGHLCQLHGQIIDGYNRRVPPTAAELSQLRMYFSEFGLTPSSRTRISKTGDGEKENRFKRNGKKAKDKETSAN